MIIYLLLSLGPALGALALLGVFARPEVAGAVGIGAAVTLFLVGEAISASREEVDRRAVVRDVVHAVLSSATAQIGLVGATLLLGLIGRQSLQWPLALQVVCVVVGSDFASYWAHRAQHRVKLLWAPHALHHSPRALYWLNGLRAHPGDTAWGFVVSTLWVLVAGFSVEAFVVSSVILTSHLLLQHTRLSFPRWLESVVVTPAWHRVHHDRAAATELANLGQIFTVWDRWFGTYRSCEPRPDELGIETEYRDSLAGELSLPWTILRK